MSTENYATTEGMGPMARSPGSDLDRAGFQTDGYIDKKGITAAQAENPNTRYNQMPPGMFIEDQIDSDIRALPMKNIVDPSGYPGDGWSGATDAVPE